MSEEKKVLICVPIDQPHVAEATQDKCSECGQLVWVAPSSRKLIEQHPDMVIMCIPCVMPKIKEGDRFVPVSEAQKIEIRDYVQENSKWN